MPTPKISVKWWIRITKYLTKSTKKQMKSTKWAKRTIIECSGIFNVHPTASYISLSP